MRPRRCVYAFACVFGLLLMQGTVATAHADSFTYDLTSTAVQRFGGTLGIITGTFVIDTSAAPCPGDYCAPGGYTGAPPVITASSLFWDPSNGTAVQLSISGIQLLLGGASSESVNETCSLASGSFCTFLIDADGSNTSGYGADGQIDVSGTMGQQLNVVGGYDSDWAVSGPSGTVDGLDTVLVGSATEIAPEPPTGLLFLLGMVLVSIAAGAKTLEFWEQESARQ